MVREPLYVILLGPPGSGKGTQARRLRKELGLTQVASGDLFREHLKNETGLGRTAKVYLDRGELVPDDLTIKMVMDRLARPDCAIGAILDGFPRTVPQARSLKKALASQNLAVNLVICISVPDDVIIERLSGRWICPVCDRVYHIAFNPPKQPGYCDLDGATLYQRSDDQANTVRKRLDVYAEKTAPLIDYYGKQALLVNIDGDQPIEDLTNLLIQLIQTKVSLECLQK